MDSLESIALVLSIASVVIAIVLSLVAFIRKRKQDVHHTQETSKAAVSTKSAFDIASGITVIITILLITTAIVSRAIETGHGPFSNMYEFALAFSWGIILAGFIFHLRYKTGSLLNISLIIALLLLIFARVQYTPPNSLIPALQQSALLSAHVASAVVAYGTLTIGFIAAVLYLIQNKYQSPWLPDLEVLDNITYKSVIIGFPFLTLLIVLGALWADIAWGRYWGWDPKETASLVTWLIYAAYMHTRLLKGWKGVRASILLIAGFIAIAFTFFGNYIFSGLHSY
ncbi:MAG: c-type cytochrome biogenesis protein CcsB [Dehalococcoidales bacterium]|jgi:cytochrome c-type biogenesis protein CcsB|nr:c-type cytochrome biogenesis protein CcsB [Dehalococcoidales bacterium]